MKKLLVLALALLPLVSTAAVEDFGYYITFTGTGVNDNDVLFTTTELSKFDACMLKSSAGAVDVFGKLRDDDPYSTAPISLQDFGATSNDPVLVTAAGRVYAVAGKYKRLQVLQNGATAATAVLLCWKQ